MATGGEDDRALLFDLEKSGEIVNAICKLKVRWYQCTTISISRNHQIISNLTPVIDIEKHGIRSAEQIS